MNKPIKVDAIRGLGWEVNQEFDKLDYLGETPPTDSAIDIKLASMISDWEAQEYARNRKAEYDALNQLELISDDTINGTSTHKDAVEAIKAKYPKPE